MDQVSQSFGPPHVEVANEYAVPVVEEEASESVFGPIQAISSEDQITSSAYGKYRKAIVAAFGVLLIALGLYSDNAWSFDDTRTLVEAIGAALGVYEVPNDQRVS